MKYYIGLMNKDNAAEIDGLVKRETEFKDIVQYLWGTNEATLGSDVNIGVYITEDMIDDAISLATVWDMARLNTADEAEIVPISHFLGAIAGNAGLIVVTNKSGWRGAATILNKEKLREVLPAGKYIAMPSSIHEFLLTPYSNDKKLNEITEIVMEVNATQVAPKERLTDMAYVIEL